MLFGSGGTEPQGASVPVTGVPGVVAVSVEHGVLGTVTLEELTDVVASGHLLTPRLAASPLTWQTATGRMLVALVHTDTPAAQVNDGTAVDDGSSTRSLTP